ncbi:MAG: hypothetical protein U0470_07345 [Anaerolineae bacterium]
MPAAVSAIDPITDVEVWVSVGAGVNKNADGTVDVSLWQSQVPLSPTITVSVWIGDCAGNPIAPKLHIADLTPLAGILPMNKVGTSTEYRAVITSSSYDNLASLLESLCARTVTPVDLSVSWECPVGQQVDVRIGSLDCAFWDPLVLRDPRGSAERPTSGCPGIPGWKAQIFQISTTQGANTPVPQPGGANCSMSAPAGGWQWATSKQTTLKSALLSPATGWSPEDNEQLTSEEVLVAPTAKAGIFAWDAPSTVSGCFYIKLSKPDTVCSWYSPVFGLSGTNDIIDLDVDFKEVDNSCDVISATPCP